MTETPVSPNRVRTVAFYLPQFHAIPENDEWWGEGFTEWTNVRRATPQFDGHDQPRRAGELGEYDLTDRTVYARQSELARQYGIDAFCMYFYWFDGHRLLERPVDQWSEDGTLLPYCLSWANESWTRRWDGKERDVLMPQTYCAGFADAIFADLVGHFNRPHYLQCDGRPVLVVHRADLIPDPRTFATRLRALAKDAGLPGLHLVAAETKAGLDPRILGFDAVAEFPPVGTNTLSSAQLRPLKGVSREFKGRLMSYPRVAGRFVRRRRPAYVRYPGVMPGWDNTARRGANATIYVGSTPNLYHRWLAAARDREAEVRGADGLVFVNAWNEWAEGAYLEPDASSNRAFLDHGTSRERQLQSVHGTFWSVPQLRSIALAFAGSVVSLTRQFRQLIRVTFRV